MKTKALRFGLCLALAGCSEDPLTHNLRIVTGFETDTFSASPAVTKVRITATTATGDSYVAETTPGGSFDLGEVPTDVPLGVEVAGSTAEGVVVVGGRSLSGLVIDAFATADIPVFVQRVGTFARPPGALTRAHIDAPAAVLGERFLATTGGTKALDEAGEANPKFGDFYDLIAWNGAVTTAALDEPARSIIGRFDGMLLVSDKSATWLDSAGSTTSAPLPDGLASFADVAGGYVVDSPSGTSFLIGATRSTGPTPWVLAMTSDGTLSAHKLLQPRQGAAAAWAPSVGLVVAGGSTTGTGLEILPEGQTTFVAKDFPADPIEGAAAVITTDNKIALVGGVLPDGSAAPTRTFSPTCSASCTTAETAGATLPVALRKMRAFSLGQGRALAIGEETTTGALVRVFEVDLGAATQKEHALREPRSGAAVVPAPNGTLAILGGALPDGSAALHVECFLP